jgi:flagellar biosynthetic protein FliR
MILAGIVLLAMSMSSIGFRVTWLWQQAFDKLGQALGVI